MSDPLDLQAEGLKILETFARSLCDGRDQQEVFAAFIVIAARCQNVAAVLIEASDPDSADCPLCRAGDAANEAAHDMAHNAGKKELHH
jgi:hypothetical protein